LQTRTLVVLPRTLLPRKEKSPCSVGGRVIGSRRQEGGENLKPTLKGELKKDNFEGKLLPWIPSGKKI